METTDTSIYAMVTHSIIAEFQRGAVPWVKPWKDGIGPYPRNAISERPYTGVNVLLLWNSAFERGYTNPGWLTFKQARELAGSIKQGESGTRIVSVSRVMKIDIGDGARAGKALRLLRWYHVFNIEQTSLPAYLYASEAETPLSVRFKEVERFLEKVGANVRHKGDEAFYNPAYDAIYLPPRETFAEIAHYYATSLHEHIHWTGHSNRLNRILDRFAERRAATEELIAELGAAYLSASFGIPGLLRHPGHIPSWLDLLRSDAKAIFAAASAASRAVDYLRSRSHPAWMEDYDHADE